jgi:hypothetical protein
MPYYTSNDLLNEVFFNEQQMSSHAKADFTIGDEMKAN